MYAAPDDAIAARVRADGAAFDARWGLWMPIKIAARLGDQIAHAFGVEPRGILVRPTYHVLPFIYSERDEDALNARVQRAMMKAT